MDSTIRCRFFQVENLEISNATFFDCLSQLWESDNRDQYEEIFAGVRVRIERLAQDENQQNFWEGEFVRQQVENIPPSAPNDSPLSGLDDPIGHRCAFRYHPQMNILLLESRRESVTPTRIDGLIKARVRPHAGFYISPVLSQTALDRLRNGTPRKVRVRVANPANVTIVEGDETDIEGNLERFQNMFGGTTIEVSAGFSRGNKSGILERSGIQRAINWAAGNRDRVEHMSVKILEESDPIDIFSEQVKATESLDLDNSDVNNHYLARQSFLRRTFNSNFRVLEEIYR